MTLSGSPKETTYTPSEYVPGVGVPEQDDDDSGALGSFDGKPLGSGLGGPLGAPPSLASTKIDKPNLGLAIIGGERLYFDEDGNYVSAKAPPVNRDFSTQITAALNRLQQQTSITGVSNSFTKSIVSFMAMPEFVSMINDLSTDDVFSVGDEGRLEKRGKVILGELAADVGMQVVTAMRNADMMRLLDSTVASTDEEMIKSQNVITFFDEAGPEMEPWMRQNFVTMLATLPTHPYALPNPVVGGFAHGVSNFFASVQGKDTQTYEEFSNTVAEQTTGRNFREEVAASALVRWREQPPRTQEEKAAFTSWFYAFAQQKSLEARAIEGHLGALAYTLDLPRQGVTNRINEVINNVAFPNDTLNRNHLPAGENIALALGMSSQDESPSWVFDSPAGKVVDFSVENVINVATPVTAVVSLYNVARGGEALDTPFLTEFYDEFKQMNSFQLTAGGYQLSTFFWADPINYAAGIGLGYKAAKTIPRFEGVTRALQLRRAATPLRGAASTGVRGGMSARITHAMLSQTTSEMINAARAGSRQGNKLVRAFLDSESTSAIIRKVPQLEGNRLVVPLKRLVDTGDIDGFWDLIQLSMSGANEASSPFLFNSIKSKASIALTELHSATKKALENGEIGIRDVMTGLYGMHPNSTLYEQVGEVAAAVVQKGDVSNPGVAESATRNARHMAAGEIVEQTDNFVIRKSGKEYGAFDVQTGESLGSLSISRKEFGVTATRQNEGIGTALRRAGMNDGHDVDAILASSDAVTEDLVRFIGKVRAKEAGRTVLRISTESADVVAPGANRTAINYRLGWKVDDGLDETVIGRIREVDPELADALAYVRNKQALQASVAVLPNEMVTRLERIIDDVLEADAIAIGDDIMVGASSEYKIINGLDISTPEGTLERLLPQQTANAVQSTIITDMLDGSQRSVMLIDQLPRRRVAANFWEKAGKWAGSDSNLAVARFGRRLKASAQFVSPGDIDPSKVSDGLTSLKRRLKIHGASRSYIDRAEEAWLVGITNEDRYVAASLALSRLSDDVGIPALFQAYGDGIARFGETGYGKRLVGDSFEEIGSAMAADRTLYISPTITEHHQRVLQLGDAYAIEKEAARYRRAGKLPNQLVVGFGKTKDTRTEIALAYKKQLIDKSGADAWRALGPDEPARMNVAMSVAFADMLDHTNRGTGLGQVNRAFSAMNRYHKGFHTTFTLAQLAGRPFAWASRVLMEEHIRGWLAGLPSLASNPTGYLANAWNARLVDRVDVMLGQQLKQAEKSAGLLFGGNVPIREALNIADEIVPGWSSKIAKSGIDITDKGQLKAQWTSMLSRALGNNEVLTSTRRGSITERVLRKQRSLDRIVKRHNEWFGFDPRIENWDEIAPELTGASIVEKFATELEGSIGEMRFTPNLKAKTRAAVAAAHAKKAQQVMGGTAGRVAIQRMLQKLRGEAVTYTGERFARTRNWADIRHNIEDVARARGFVPDNDAALAEWYLDVIMRQDWIESNFKYFWGDSPAEKIRILDEIVTSRQATIKVGGAQHTVTLKQKEYSKGKNAWAALFDDLDTAGRHEEVLPVMGVFNAYFAEESADINKVKKITNWILETFGEKASQNLHRRPAYLAERRRYLDIYKRLGWEPEDAAQIAHEKAFTTVNWLFFNNHHTGELLRRMNKTIPFFSAWAEVMSTWAYKIPSMNVLGVGHAAMIHKIDNIMQGFARMGIVSIDDSGQWRMNFEEDSASLSPAGRGISAMGHRMLQTPTATVVQAANIGNWLKSGLTEEEYEAYDVSDWAKDNYSIAIGSPVKLNSHGVMGVNQWAFGFTPDISYLGDLAADKISLIGKSLFSWADNPIAQRVLSGGDTQTIAASTLAEAYEQMPESMSQSEFLALNQEAIVGQIGLDSYRALFKDGREFLPPDSVDLSGIPLQLPGTSFFDQVVDPMLYPFGHIESPVGVIRSVVPSSASYVLRGALGLYANGSGIGDGIVNVLTGPLQQYQVDGEVHSAMMKIEAEDGTYTKINQLTNEITGLLDDIGAESPEDIARLIQAGSPEAELVASLEERLEYLNASAAKRVSDMAFHATVSRGLTGLFGPATPQASYRDQVFKSEYYATKEIAEVLNERGDFDWTPLWQSGAIKSKDDFLRANVEIRKWYEDPSGGDTKAFILENYPSLLAWITPSTFWGEAGSPPLGRDIDTTMDAILTGSKKRLPDDVVMQKLWRTAVEAQYESDLIANSGTNDQVEQALWALSNPDTYRGVRDEKRNSIKSLDWYDDFYNNGNYHKYRDSEDDTPSLFEQWEEGMFALSDAGDEVIDAISHAGIADDEQQGRTAGIVRASIGEYWDARREALDNMGILRTFWSEREEFLNEYQEQVVRPYDEIRDAAFKLLNEAESSAERGIAFEMLRAADNEHFGQQHSVEYNGTMYRVPNELQRKWNLNSEEEKTEQMQEWAGLDVKYLSEFAIDTMVDRKEGFRSYLPWEQQPQNIIANATDEKVALLTEVRANPRLWTSYKKQIAIDNIEADMQGNLVAAGYSNIVQYMEAWPMERLVITGTLPPEMGKVAGWFIGIHNDLESIGKTPTSDAGQDMFFEFGNTLDAYFSQNPDGAAKFKSVGSAMFGESAMWALYYRFAGVRFGDAGQ